MNRFLQLEELLEDHAVYLTKDWDGLLYDEPDGTGRAVVAEPETAVRVVSKLRVEDQLWFEVRLPGEDACGEVDEGVSEATGWVPANSANGRPVVWYWSRGC